MRSKFSIIVLTTILCLAAAFAAYGVATSYPAAAGVTAIKAIKASAIPGGKPVVSFTLTNKSAQPLNALFYSDHLPTNVAVKALGVTVNGLPAVVVPTKTGAGAVCPNLITHTWEIQPLAKYGTTNTVKALTGTVVITYELTFPKTGSYFLEGYSWAGKLGPKTGAASNVVFGYASAENYSGIRERVSANARGGLSLVTASSGAYHLDYRPGQGETVAGLRIVSASGQLIHSVSPDRGRSGVFRFVWDGRDSSGRAVSTGTYLVQVRGNTNTSRRLVVLR